jgi:putative CocE/NonD family hydrolase
MLPVRPRETLSLQTRDGIRLDADVYRPDAPGAFPVLLMRQPYGRQIASTVVYAHPTWYAAHGYIVVIQDVRGRGTSKGVFSPFAMEVEDGYDTVMWAANLPDSTGDVGMYGFSYQGMTQLYAAGAHPPALKALCPAMLPYDLYTDMAYEGGTLCLQAKLGWAIQLATETARLKGDRAAYHALYAASRNLPLSDPIPARPEVLQRYAADSFYFDWLDHPNPADDYWAKHSPRTYLDTVDLPMLHIGGWFDLYLRGTVGMYRAMAERSSHPQHLLIGPWVHIPWGRRVGAVDFGTEAVSPVDRLQIRWFDQLLKGQDTGLLQEPPVRLFEMGNNQWRSLPAFSPTHRQSLFLCTTGLAGISEAEGSLQAILPNVCPTDVLVHDPWRPVPSLGGHAGFPGGCFERGAIDCRSDVLTYTTKPLQRDLHLLGEIQLEVYCSTDAPSFDLCAVLSEVRSTGVYNFTQGYRRVEPGQSTTPLSLTLQPTCMRIASGNALRLSLSAACFPAYAVNPGTGTHPANATLLEAQIITLTVRCGGQYISRLLLPVLDATKN